MIQVHKCRINKLALEDVALAALGHLGFIAEAQLGHERPRYGNDLFGAFGRDFVTADGARIMVVGLTSKQWRSLCTATGIGDQAKTLGAQIGVNLDLEGERFKARDAIASLVGPWIAARKLSEVATTLDSQSVCWGRYQSVKQLVDDDPACSEANPMFCAVPQPGVGTILSPAIPLDFGSGRLPAQAAPELGAHTDEVLASLLKLSSSEIGRLHDQHIVGT